MNKRHYEHTLPNIRGSLSNTYYIRMFPDVEYSTDRDFFLENQIVCIVSREGTKFCSLIENRLFMCSQSRHISKRMQLHIMCEIHKEICRLRYGGEPVE